MLLEFFMQDLWPDEANLTTESGKSMVSVNLLFHRELGNMVNTYFQVRNRTNFLNLPKLTKKVFVLPDVPPVPDGLPDALHQPVGLWQQVGQSGS